MIAIEGDSVRCGECGATYSVRVYAVGRCVRCGSARLNSDVVEPTPAPIPREFKCLPAAA